MDKEEFLKRIKDIKVNVSDEYFFLEYNVIVCNILEENLKLKKQLQQKDDIINNIKKFISSLKTDSPYSAISEDVKKTILETIEDDKI